MAEPADTRRLPRTLLVLCLGLAAASGALAFAAIGDGAVATAPGSERLEVSFDEWSVETAGDPIEAGPVTVAVENRGAVDHELLILKTNLPAGELPQGISGPNPKLAGDLVLGRPHQHVSTNDSYAVLDRAPDRNTRDHIQPGERIAVEVELTPGDYALYCNLPGHYNRGQFTSLTATAPTRS